MAKKRAHKAQKKRPADPEADEFNPSKIAKRAPFLEAFRKCGTILRAAEAAKLGRRTVYTWLEKDPEFKAMFDQANTEVTDIIEDALFKRATQGVTNPVFHEGYKCGEKTEYSDTAAIFLLKARDPKRFNERMQIELAGKADAPVNIVYELVDTRKPDKDQGH
jgi:hypothetical protein